MYYVYVKFELLVLGFCGRKLGKLPEYSELMCRGGHGAGRLPETDV